MLNDEYLGRLSGMRVVTSPLLVEDGEPITVRRSWRERLLSRPWRPWVTTRTVVPKVPLKGGILLDRHTWVMHPETYRVMQEGLR